VNDLRQALRKLLQTIEVQIAQVKHRETIERTRQVWQDQAVTAHLKVQHIGTAPRRQPGHFKSQSDERGSEFPVFDIEECLALPEPIRLVLDLHPDALPQMCFTHSTDQVFVQLGIVPEAV
jgi:hypothetical protein